MRARFAISCALILATVSFAAAFGLRCWIGGGGSMPDAGANRPAAAAEKAHHSKADGSPPAPAFDPRGLPHPARTGAFVEALALKLPTIGDPAELHRLANHMDLAAAPAGWDFLWERFAQIDPEAMMRCAEELDGWGIKIFGVTDRVRYQADAAAAWARIDREAAIAAATDPEILTRLLESVAANDPRWALGGGAGKAAISRRRAVGSHSEGRRR